jgi:hypothetical protein
MWMAGLFYKRIQDEWKELRGIRDDLDYYVKIEDLNKLNVVAE